MTKTRATRDRFDDQPIQRGRVGAHRAEQPHMHRGVVLLWTIVTAAVLTAIGIVVLLLMMRTPEAPAPAPSGGVQLLDENYEVFVLNGTTDSTRGDAVEQALEGLGWPADRVHVSNASVHDFPSTVLFYTSDDDAEFARALASTLQIQTVEESDAYAGLTTSDELRSVAVVLGADDE